MLELGLKLYDHDFFKKMRFSKLKFSNFSKEIFRKCIFRIGLFENGFFSKMHILEHVFLKKTCFENIRANIITFEKKTFLKKILTDSPE